MRALTEREKEFAKIMHDLGKIGQMIDSGKDEVIIKKAFNQIKKHVRDFEKKDIERFSNIKQ